MYLITLKGENNKIELSDELGNELCKALDNERFKHLYLENNGEALFYFPIDSLVSIVKEKEKSVVLCDFLEISKQLEEEGKEIDHIIP